MKLIDTSEWLEKHRRLVEFLDRHQLDGVFLWNRNNFAWITCGRDSHVAMGTPVGAAGIYASRDRCVCIANEIEAPRFLNEELQGTGIDVLSFPWFDPDAGRRLAREVFDPAKVACDSDELHLGLCALPPDFAKLRWQLLPDEIARYRDGAKRASGAIETVCTRIQPAMTEHEIAGWVAHCAREVGCLPVVNLIACDERVFNYRHPIPTNWKLRRYVMLVICSEYKGLISNLTRFVHFGKLTEELKSKQQSIANIDAAVNLATKPGRTLGEVFRDLQDAYVREGFADGWKKLHQGGITGYATREVVASPTCEVPILSNQAMAWNPSVTGIKSEDTVLLTDARPEVLTVHSNMFPTVVGMSPQGALPRAGILVR